MPLSLARAVRAHWKALIHRRPWLKQQVSTGTAIVIIIVVLLVAGLVVWKFINRNGGGSNIKLNGMVAPAPKFDTFC